jgi:hypothetical protein
MQGEDAFYSPCLVNTPSADIHPTVVRNASDNASISSNQIAATALHVGCADSILNPVSFPYPSDLFKVVHWNTKSRATNGRLILGAR